MNILRPLAAVLLSVLPFAIAAAGDAPLHWDFTSFTNSSARTIDVTADVLAMDARLSGRTLRLMANLGGFIQIGGYSAAGELAVAPDAADCDLLVLTAARHANRDYGRHMPIRLRRRDGSVVDLAVLTLGDEPAEYQVPLPPLGAGDAIVLSSTTNHLAAANPRCAVNLVRFGLVSPKLDRNRRGLTLIFR